MTTFTEFAEQIVAERAKYIRGPRKEMNRYELHVKTAGFAPMELEQIKARHIIAWHTEMASKTARDQRAERSLSKATIERCHALVSVVFAEAIRRELIASSPCVGVKLRMPDTTADTEDERAYLTLEEMSAIKVCTSIPEWDRWGMQFGWGTGLRQGEQCNLGLRDVHVDDADPFVYVRFGSPGLLPKSKKPRSVPLFGDGLEAARELVRIAATVSNPNGLLFPSRVGSVRGVGKPLGRGRKVDGKWRDPFRTRLLAAGIDRPEIHWHSLRHTAASHLVMGSWGRRWSIEEIKEFLGHANINVTQVYAHLGESALKAAARETAVSVQVPATVSAPKTEPDHVVEVQAGRVQRMLRGLKRIVMRVTTEVTRLVA